jgi:hypothetical protein
VVLEAVVVVIVVEQVRWLVILWPPAVVPGTRATVELVPAGMVLNSTRGAVTVREDQVMVVHGACGVSGAAVISTSGGDVIPGTGAVTVWCCSSGAEVGGGCTMSMISGLLGT